MQWHAVTLSQPPPYMLMLPTVLLSLALLLPLQARIEGYEAEMAALDAKLNQIADMADEVTRASGTAPAAVLLNFACFC